MAGRERRRRLAQRERSRSKQERCCEKAKASEEAAALALKNLQSWIGQRLRWAPIEIFDSEGE